MAKVLGKPAAPFKADFKDPEAFTRLAGEAASFRSVAQSGTDQARAQRANSGRASRGAFPTKDTETGDGAAPVPSPFRKMDGGMPSVFKKGA